MAAASQHAAVSVDVGGVRGVRCGLVAWLCGVRYGVACGVAWRGVARL